jgi:hypothetical protein
VKGPGSGWRMRSAAVLELGGVSMAAAPWIVPDELWELIEPLLPKRERPFPISGSEASARPGSVAGDLVCAAHGDRLAAVAG